MDEQVLATHAFRLATALDQVARSHGFHRESDQIRALVAAFQEGPRGLTDLSSLLESLAGISRRMDQGPVAGGPFF